MTRIIYSDFTALKTRVKNEMNRRNGTGSLTTFGGATYDYTVVPANLVPVLKEHYSKLRVPMANLIYSINADLGAGTKPVEQSDVTLFGSALSSAEAKNRYTQHISSSYSYYGTTDCNSSCSGTCVTACVGQCVGCSGSCTGSCTGGCYTGCTGCTGSCVGGCTGCGTSCSTNCSTTCSGLCDAECADFCAVNCAFGCGSGSQPFI